MELAAAEHVVRALRDLLESAFVDHPGAEDVLPHVLIVVVEDVDHGRDADRVADHRDRPQGQLRDDVLPHLLVRHTGEGGLDVGGFLQGHDEAVRELAAHLVRDAGWPLVDEGEDQVEFPRLPRESAERVRVRRDLRAQEFVGLLEEQDEPREFLVPFRVQVEETAGEDVRDEQVHHLVRAVVSEVEDDALSLPDRRQDVVERVLALLRLLEEREAVQATDPALEPLEGHLMGPLGPEDLHRRLLHSRDEVAPGASFRDLIERVDHGCREVLQGDDQVLGRDLPRVEDEGPRLLVLRIEGEDLDLSREEELQALRVVGRAEDAVFAVHVEDQDGAGVARDDPGTHELVQDRFSGAGASEDRERFLDQLLHVQLYVERLDARDRAERGGRVRDLVDPFHIGPGRVATCGEVRRDRLRLTQLLRLTVHELDHPELRLAVEDGASIPLVRLQPRRDHVRDRGTRELVRDVALLVQDVLDEAVEVVPGAFDDDREGDLQLLGIPELELRDQAFDHGRGDDLPDLHRRSLATLSRYSWNALRFRPSTWVSPSRTVRPSRPKRRAT